MKTLIDIQDDMMEELLKEAGTSVKKKAIVMAIETFIRLKKREKLAALVGNYDFGYTVEDLDGMRQDG